MSGYLTNYKYKLNLKIKLKKQKQKRKFIERKKLEDKIFLKKLFNIIIK
jgi:hypothetical protein